MMKEPLDWQAPAIVEIYDEVSLWSAPFGKVLLDNIPMNASWTVVDLGFGTGFPLIELAQRFGAQSTIIGVDIWEPAIDRVRMKIDRLDLSNVHVINKKASAVSIADRSVDLVCSNLGVNNFDDKLIVYQNVANMLKVNGHFCLTTNDHTTFCELFELFEKAIVTLGIDPSSFKEYVHARCSSDELIEEVNAFDFELAKQVEDSACMRFVSSRALFNHSLIRIAFIATWKSIIPPDKWDSFITLITSWIDDIIASAREFRLNIPITYLDFVKR